MATEILIPMLGMTMTEGAVAEWYIPDNGEVKAGEHVYRLETEKIEFEVEAEAAGTVRHTAPAGSVLKPGTVVGYILAPGEDMPAGAPAAEPASAAPAPASAAPAQPAKGVVQEGGRVPATPVARRLTKEAGLDLATIPGTGPGGRVTEVDVAAAKAAALQPTPPGAGADVPASPIARRLAKEKGIDLSTVTGTGPGGRITKEDVEGAETAAPVSAPASGEVIPLRGMRKVIAQRMHASLAEMAQLTLGAEVTMDEAVRLRTQLVEDWEAEGVRPTYTDLIIKAVARALLLHPRVNSTITEAGIELLGDVNIGMAVSLDDGLVVPVIRDAGTLTLRDISAASSAMATAARDGTLGPDDMAGSTFSVTSLGPGVVDFFTPIINPPNVAILGVGRIRDGIRWDGDDPRKCQEMTLSLTIDHRALDGAPAAGFLGTVRDLLESPHRLLA